MAVTATPPPPPSPPAAATLQHHQEICILNAGINQPRVTVCIGDLVRDAVSTLPGRNAYLHTSCMNGYTVHTPQSVAQPHAHSHTAMIACKHVYTQSIPNHTSSCIITLFHKKTLTRKIDIFFPLKHSIGYLIFMPK